MKLVLSRLFFAFELTNADDASGWDADGDFKNMKAFSTWQKPALNVTIKPVKR